MCSDVETVYKIFLKENNELKNLFRGIEGSRTMKFEEWLRAENKWSRNGGKSRKYLTGIHVLKNEDDAIAYLDNFMTDKNRIVIRCKAAGLRQKPTNDSIYLANWLYIPNDFEEVI